MQKRREARASSLVSMHAVVLHSSFPFARASLSRARARIFYAHTGTLPDVLRFRPDRLGRPVSGLRWTDCSDGDRRRRRRRRNRRFNFSLSSSSTIFVCRCFPMWNDFTEVRGYMGRVVELHARAQLVHSEEKTTTTSSARLLTFSTLRHLLSSHTNSASGRRTTLASARPSGTTTWSACTTARR